MYNVVLDTNILHQEGFVSANMRILYNVIKDKLVCLHIPQLVAQEFKSSKVAKLKEDSANITRSIDSINKESKRMRTTKFNIGDDIKQSVDDFEGKITKEVEAAFGKWARDFEVNFLPYEDVNTLKVFEDYFSGQGVFKTAKARNDIPDAFISESIETFASRTENVIVIINDDKLSSHLRKVGNIKAIKDLRALFDLPGLEETKASMEVANLISSTEFSEGLTTFLKSRPDYFEYYAETLDSILGDELIGQNVYGISIEITDYDEMDLLTIRDVRKVSEGKFDGVCEFEIDTGIGYVTDYGNFLKIDKIPDRSPDCWSISGNGWCDVSEDARVKFYGGLSFTLNKDISEISKGNIIGHFNDGDISASLNITDTEIVKMF